MADHKSDAELLDLIENITSPSAKARERHAGERTGGSQGFLSDDASSHCSNANTFNTVEGIKIEKDSGELHNSISDTEGNDAAPVKHQEDLNPSKDVDLEHLENNLKIEKNGNDNSDDSENDDEDNHLHLLSKNELVHSLQDCRTELDLTSKKVEQLERQLKKSDEYNGVLRNMVRFNS